MVNGKRRHKRAETFGNWKHERAETFGNGDTSAQKLLETIRSIDTQIVLTMFLVFTIAYVLGRIITILLSKLSEKMNQSGRVKVKLIIPVVKFVIYIVAFYYILGKYS